MSTSIYDYKDGKIDDTNGTRTIFKFTISKPQCKYVILRVRKSDHANDRGITLKICGNIYYIMPSFFGKCTGYNTRYEFLKSCDNYSLIFEDKNIFICKENDRVENIKNVIYPVDIQIEGGAMIMERLDIQ
jgi:hypothetical protein